MNKENRKNQPSIALKIKIKNKNSPAARFFASHLEKSWLRAW